MKLPFKIALIVIGAVLLTAFFLALTGEFGLPVFIAFYGLVGCATGILSLLTAFIISIANKEKHSYVQGLLLGGGLVLLTGAFALAYTISNISFGR